MPDTVGCIAARYKDGAVHFSASAHFLTCHIPALCHGRKCRIVKRGGMFYNGSMKKFFATSMIALVLLPAALAQTVQQPEIPGRTGQVPAIVRAQQQENADSMNLILDRELAATRTAAQNNLIAATENRLREAAAKIEAASEENTKEAEKLVEKIEKFKRAVQKFNEDYDSASPELASLRESIGEEYEQLERGVYEASSLSSALILRGSSFDEDSGAWDIHINMNFLRNYTPLTAQPLRLSYQELCGKRFGHSKEDEENVMLYDSLFRRAAPVVYARVTYRIFRWKEASEYAIIPLSATLLRTDTGAVIRQIPAERLSVQTATMLPRREIRSAAEKAADTERADLIRAKGVRALSKDEKESKSNRGSSFFAEQKGRRAIYFTADVGLFNSQLANFDRRALSLNSIKGVLAVGFKKYWFVGGSFGFDYLGSIENMEYSFGINGGASIMLCRFVRPYVEAGLEFHTNLIGVASAGTGVDIMFGKLLLNANYHFNVPYSFDSFNFQTPYHTLGAGIGFTW